MDATIRKRIIDILDANRIMTVATLRPDRWPQATTVGYVNDGFQFWFLCGRDSQKAANLARDNRVSLTINGDPSDIMAITGASMAARAIPVTDRAEAEKVLRRIGEDPNLTVARPTVLAARKAAILDASRRGLISERTAATSVASLDKQILQAAIHQSHPPSKEES